MLAAAPVALAADVDGDGTQSVGFFNDNDGTFVYRTTNTTGFADTSIRFGPKEAGLRPVQGDWDGDGRQSPGLYHQASGVFFITNTTSGAAVTDAMFRFGPRLDDWLPIAGDWDGDGQQSVGLYDADDARFYLKNSLSSGAADVVVRFGPKGQDWLPVAGDFDNDGDDDIGLWDDTNGRFYVDLNQTGGSADIVVRFGPKNRDWQPLAGDWNGDGLSTVGLRDPASGQIYQRDSLTDGIADNVFYVAPLLDTATAAATTIAAPPGPLVLTATEVEALLERAAAASASEDAIIAIVDRGGRILGVRVEQDVLTTIPDTPTRVFAIDGAVAKARTAAFFANNTAPLTSRLIRFVSQSTITQREVESNPNSADPLVRGPGFVAPVGLGGHFPPEVPHTPVVDLFAIEHTNRDSLIHPGPDGVRGTGDDIPLPSRFNVPTQFILPGQQIDAPESYGFVSGMLPVAQSRGIATLPGGIPIFKDVDGDGSVDGLVGGIGVFFPGTDGFATHEQAFVPGIGQTESERTNAPKVLEAEWIALAAVGGTLDMPIGDVNTVPPVSGIRLPLTTSTDARLTLVGIELEVVGPHPDGVWQVLAIGEQVQGNDVNAGNSGLDFPVDTVGTQYLSGKEVPSGWLVLPHDSNVDDLSADDVNRMVNNAVAEANLVRAAIRLPSGSRTKMVFSVADTDGNVLGTFRMPDATYFSIDVAVAKARNTAYYADAGDLVEIDRIPGVPRGTAFTNRTFRFVAEPRFPDGVEGTVPPPFSILTDPGTNPLTAENLAGPVAASLHTSVLGHDAFNPGTNFRDPDNRANQNGIVFFPGSTPIYQGTTLLGGFGVSGDGVDQDDVVTFFGADEFLPPDPVLRADEVFVRGVRLPYIKFLRNPEG